MAKSDLLKEAIADAKAVKETALANAKIALEEAFAPRIQSMLSAKLSEDLDEEEMDMEMDMEAPADDMEMDAPMDAAPTVTVDGEEYVKADDAGEGEAEIDNMDMDMDMDMSTDEGMDANLDAPVKDEEDMTSEDLELEAIIRELEEDLDEDETIEEGIDEDAQNPDAADSTDSKGNDLMAEPKEMSNEEFNIDEIIEEILAEDDGEAEMAKDDELKEEEEVEDKTKELEEDLHEAYETIGSLRETINEVNLLNAKLLYTNKLFRNFELSENQKMTVIENFDRAGNTREVKLVFSTLAESFQLPVKKRAIVKESFASKATGTTAPSKKATKQIINEGNELANRWKKLAGLL